MATDNALKQTRQVVPVSANKAERHTADYDRENTRLHGKLVEAIALREEVIAALGITEVLAENPNTYIADASYRKATAQIDSVVEAVTDLNQGMLTRALRPWMESGFTGADHRQDLLTVGLTALYESFLSWDPTGGSKFSSWFLNFKFKEAMATFVGSGLKGWPRRLVDSKSRIDATTALLTTQLGRAPTTDEIVAELGWSKGASAVIDVLQRVTVSIDAGSNGAVDDNTGQAIKDTLAQESAVNLEALADSGLLERLLGNAKLTPLEVFITIRRSGIDGFGTQNLANLANDTGIGRESLRRAAVKLDKKLESMAVAA